MLRRLGYRKFLPIANFLLYVALVGSYDWALVQQVRLFDQVAGANASLDGGSWTPEFIDRPRPILKVLVDAINFPAVIFATPFGALNRGWRAELIVDFVAALYLLPLWYAVGRWFDRRAIVKGGRALTIARQVIFMLAVLSALGILGLFVLGLTRYPDAWADLLFSTPIFFWPVFLAYVARWELRAAKTNAVKVEVA
jgi:hypothetical protein